MASKSNGTPNMAANAVLKPSGPVPVGAREIHGIDFDKHAGKPITVEELIDGISNMGFQASALSEAVHIINEMVSPSNVLSQSFHLVLCLFSCLQSAFR